MKILTTARNMGGGISYPQPLFKSVIIYLMDKELLIKRFKSFLWRLGAVVAVALISFLAENIGLFGLPLQAQVIAGLVLGEITKALNPQK